jgi:hypothetical protein
MDIVGQIIGYVVACFCFRIAYKLYFKDKDKTKPAALVLLVASLILLISMPWFQGFFKSFISSEIMAKFKTLGNQVNAVQDTTTEMLNNFSNQVVIIQETNKLMAAELNNHQSELEQIQKYIRLEQINIKNEHLVITNQIETNKLFQASLASAITNVNAQQKQLSDVEYWVQHLYDKSTNELFTIADTNRLMLIPNTNGGIYYFIMLSYPPIHGSIELTIDDGSMGSWSRRYYTDEIYNICHGALYKYDSNSLKLSYHYVVNENETNYYKRMPLYNKEMFLLSGKDFSVTKPEFFPYNHP